MTVEQAERLLVALAALKVVAAGLLALVLEALYDAGTETDTDGDAGSSRRAA